MSPSDAYRRAGVDLEAAAKAVTLISDLAAQTTRPEMAEGVGGFAGLFRIGEGRFLAAATDGVGTKIEIARRLGKLNTVGIDLVAMCADDVVCTGAEPLFFLDYLAVGRVVPERVASIVEGVAEGCRRAGCALLGGETAEHPGTMDEDAFDLAGFCVGSVAERDLLGSDKVQPGDALVGLASSGLHSNGFSLVRKALLDDASYPLEAVPEGFARTLGEELLVPCAIYAPSVLALARDGFVHAAVHITGGGFFENVPRGLPEGLGADLQRGTWSEPPIFDLVRRASGASDEEMFATFNMGLGMILVVPSDRTDEALARAVEMGTSATVLGRTVPGSGVRIAGLG